jgi:hypothetical protein
VSEKTEAHEINKLHPGPLVKSQHGATPRMAKESLRGIAIEHIEDNTQAENLLEGLSNTMKDDEPISQH